MSKRDEIIRAAGHVVEFAITETAEAAARIAAEEASKAAKAQDFRGLAVAEAIEQRIRRELKGENP